MSIAHIPPLVALCSLIVIVFGPMFGLYLLFSRDSRRKLRLIRNAAAARGWRYSVRRSQGNPFAFRLDGATANGLAWVFTTGNSSEGTHDWSTEATIKFPSLGGEPDFAIMPRDSQRNLPDGPFPLLDPDAREFPSGEPAFDGLYQVFGLQHQFKQPPIDRTLAKRILGSPLDVEGQPAPHRFARFMVMRGRLGFYCQARLPGPSEWTTVTWLVGIAEDFAASLPPALDPATPPGFVDRMIDACLQ